jgi:hypothetical protein
VCVCVCARERVRGGRDGADPNAFRIDPHAFCIAGGAVSEEARLEALLADPHFSSSLPPLPTAATANNTTAPSAPSARKMTYADVCDVC